MTDEPYKELVSGEVLWYILHLEPVTTPELESNIPDERLPNGNAVSSTVIRLWRSGLLVRRKRQQAGQAPYEYAVAIESELKE